MMIVRPVKIPEAPGKITMTKIGDAHYVKYQTGREYDAERKYNIPKRVVIGVQIENMPTMMMPNENYAEYFTKDGREIAAMSEWEKEETEKTGEEEEFRGRWETFQEYREFFLDLFYEIKAQSRGRLETKVPEYQAAAMNEILEPLRELLKGESYGRLLEMISAGETSYGDAMILLCKYKTALGKYYSERL
jgi:hypothetical protein